MRLVAFALCLMLICHLPVFAGQDSEKGQKNAELDAKYSQIAGQLLGSAIMGSGAYDKLEYLTDQIGNRISGSPQLDDAIKWAVATMKADGLENVHTEAAKVPHWVRGEEYAEMLTPAKHKLTILGLGGTVGTPPSGITAEVVEVNSYEQLEKLGSAVKDKIVFYNVPMRKDIDPFEAYGPAVQFRGSGASRAAKYGAVAVLVRSVTTVSLNTPHTGAMRYAPDVPQIPAAAVTLENADLMHRLIARGKTITVKLFLGAQKLPDADSANVIGEIRGSEFPDEVVLIGGHIDSWDVGTGATDDGAGCVTVMEAAALLVKLHIRPRRTIRVVLFTNEENGLRGGAAYRDAHMKDYAKHIAAIEADAGGARPLGFSFGGKERGLEFVKRIAPILEKFNAGAITVGEGGADISVITSEGVPGLGLRPDPTHYFDLHHTNADTLDKINRLDLSLNAAAMAIMAYYLADTAQPLPRD